MAESAFYGTIVDSSSTRPVQHAPAPVWSHAVDGTYREVGVNDGGPFQRIEAEGVVIIMTVTITDGRLHGRLLLSGNGLHPGAMHGNKHGLVVVNFQLELIVSGGVLRDNVRVIHVVGQYRGTVGRGCYIIES